MSILSDITDECSRLEQRAEAAEARVKELELKLMRQDEVAREAYEAAVWKYGQGRMRLEAQVARLRAALGLTDVWPLFDVLAKLCAAVQHMRLVQERSTEGYEQWYHAADAGERLIPKIKAALSGEEAST